MDRKPSILIIIFRYLPNTRSNGPAKSVNGMIQRLYHDFDFWVLTADRDYGDLQVPANLKVGSWQPITNGQVFHLPRKALNSPFQLRKYLRTFHYDLVSLHHYFGTVTVVYLLLRRLGWVVNKPTVIVPHGCLMKGALAHRPLKKQVYLWLANRLGLNRNVLWRATSEHEMQEIRRLFPHAEIFLAPNLSPTLENLDVMLPPSKPNKLVGHLKLAYLSQIHPKKQLHWALETLAKVSGTVEFSIYGPVFDGQVDYWEKCKALVAHLPPNIQVSFCGEVAQNSVFAVLQNHHMFILPTKDENYGHAIVEALLAGCPVIISDRTPWRDLPAKQVGWDLPLDDENAFIEVLNTAVMMDDHTFQVWSKSAHDYGLSIINDEAVVNANRLLFQQALTMSTER